MADRTELLDRLCLALSRPGVNGVLGTPDVLEDLLLLGALDGKVVVGLSGPAGSFTIRERPLRRIVNVETFVQMAGGEYFFLPSLPALDYLAGL